MDSGEPFLRLSPRSQSRWASLSLVFIWLALTVGCVSDDSSGTPSASPPPRTTDPIQVTVDRLDLERYKAAIRELGQFGDRRQSTPRNGAALDWLEVQLRSYGYASVERHTYGDQGAPYQNIYATKVGTSVPQEMYIVSAHLDGLGGGEAADDDASGCAVVLELARVLAATDVATTRSVRFVFWNNEEEGRWRGSRSYVRERGPLQGIEDPPGSGQYPEPAWLGLIQHDMVLFDHGLPPRDNQRQDADLNIEYQIESALAAESVHLARQLQVANQDYSDYPASIGSHMSATDSRWFQDRVAAVSIRENERNSEIDQGANPHWHQESDIYNTYNDADFRLGLSAAQTTLGLIGRLVEVILVEP